MKCTLVGSRHFGALVFEALRGEEGIRVAHVVAPADDDRLALAAKAAGHEVHVLANPKWVPGEAIAPDTDLIVAAHTHARVSEEALARSRLGGIGYHPSLLPRHRGIAAVEWTVMEGDPIAGGSVYHLADGWDDGAIAAQDWCFVAKGETARELWERALAPMGLRLLTQVVQHARRHGALPAHAQDSRFATKAPMLRKPVVSPDEHAMGPVSLVVTVMGRDRPGIVSSLSDCGQRFGANWSASRMARAAGEFAGMVQFDVPRENADALTRALRGLESGGLQVAIAASGGSPVPPAMQAFELELVGADRVGIVSRLTRMLAQRGISIDNLHTEIVGGAGQQTFRIGAHLLVPGTVAIDVLRQELGSLAGEMALDIGLGERGLTASRTAC